MALASLHDIRGGGLARSRHRYQKSSLHILNASDNEMVNNTYEIATSSQSQVAVFLYNMCPASGSWHGDINTNLTKKR